MSFKVVCTNHEDHKAQGIIKIPIGSMVTVVDTKQYEGYNYYRIEEYPMSACGLSRAWYWEGNFSPCNGPDETEILEERLADEIARLDADYENIGAMFPASDASLKCFVPFDQETHDKIWEAIEAAMNQSGGI